MKSMLNIKNLKTKNTIFTQFSKSYHTHPITYPSSLPKPMNPWDNMDPGRSDRSVVDEYDKINRKFKPGDLPPNAWRANRDFPEWYRPYLLNYNGHGYLLFYLLVAGLCKINNIIKGIFYQREQIKKIKGRKVLQDYKHEKKNFHSIFKIIQLRREVRDNQKDPYINYLRRYIKESGF